MNERSDGCSGETLLAPCARKKRLQRKMTTVYCWKGNQENTAMFSKSWNNRISFHKLPMFERPVVPMFNKLLDLCND